MFDKPVSDTLDRVKCLIKIGSSYAFKDFKGKPVDGYAVVTRASGRNNFFWAKCVIPTDKKFNGQEFPFSHAGKYMGSIHWERPDIDPGMLVEIDEEIVTEEEFTGDSGDVVTEEEFK